MLCIPKPQGAEPADVPWGVCSSLPVSIPVEEMSGSTGKRAFLEQHTVRNAVSLRLKGLGGNTPGPYRRNI